MQEEYRRIFEKLQERGDHRCYECFQAHGDPNLKNRLMLVGRAVNGWKPFSIDKNFDDFYSPAIKPLCQDGNVEKYFRDNSDNYNMNRSAFWRVARAITTRLYGCGCDNFGQYLCYSNLYKVALSDKNPPSWLQRLQLPECIEILRKEIQLWRPAYLLFLTDENWASPFLNDLASKDGLADAANVSPWIKYCGTFPWGGRLVVLPHPQCKPEQLLIEGAMTFFQK